MFEATAALTCFPLYYPRTLPPSVSALAHLATAPTTQPATPIALTTLITLTTLTKTPVAKFYAVRQKLYAASRGSEGDGAVGGDSFSPSRFHSNHLEYTLDDNYQTRMLCGPPAHDHPIPISREHLDCALRHLEEYTVVGVMERFEETLCVLSSALGIERPVLESDPHATGARGAPIPSDLVDRWRQYVAYDEVLLAHANARLDANLRDRGGCGG